jgi:putative radical SAM enzyme (TIGR03279 family)
MDFKEHKIDMIEPGSIAEELGIAPGDLLLAVNGKPIQDVFDYHFLINDDALTVLVRKPDGQEWELEIEKDYYEDLGIGFANGLMDDYKSCFNKCIFCFIDQMPPNMRETLYFKDDDSRLSFLQGNYVTLTNMKEEDVERIITYKLAPINVSVHTTNPDLRCKMLNNRFAGEALDKIRRFYEAGIQMNGQIVLCKGINDGAELERSIRDLSEYLPYMESVSVVPVGLTKYRDGLYPLQPFTKEDAKEVLATIHKWQDICYEKHQNHFIHAGDEWYLLAEEPFPTEETYDGYIQLENGVGMMPLLQNEFEACLAEEKEQQAKEKRKLFAGLRKEKPQAEHVISIATGKLAAPLLRKLSIEFSCQHPNIKILVYEIENRFFGERITVSGLLTGQDIRNQLTGQELGEKLLLPCNLLRSGEEVFLDDMTLTELENALQVPIHIVKSDGQCLYEELLCEETN